MPSARVGVVNRLLHCAQEQVSEQRRFVRSFDLAQKFTQLFGRYRGFLFELVSKGLSHLTKDRDALGVGLSVDSEHPRRRMPFDVCGDGLVRDQHHVLDDAVRLPNAGIAARLDDFLRLPVCVEDDLPFRKIEIECASLQPPRAKPLRQVEENLQCGDSLFCRRLGRALIGEPERPRDALVVEFAVRPHDSFEDPMRAHMPLLIDVHLDRHAQTVAIGDEGREVGR